MSSIKTTKRVGDLTPPWGTPSLNFTRLLKWLSILTLAVLILIWFVYFASFIILADVCYCWHCCIEQINHILSIYLILSYFKFKINSQFEPTLGVISIVMSIKHIFVAGHDKTSAKSHWVIQSYSQNSKWGSIWAIFRFWQKYYL